jgi:3-oxoacyl-[acyl-carrier protein] reductase
VSDEIVLITGASSDIGVELTRRLAGTSATVFAHHHKGGARLGEIAPRVRPVAADLRDEADVRRLVETVAAAGCPSKIVHLPGLPLRMARFPDLDWARLDDDLHLQVRSLGWILQAFLPRMAKEGVRGKVVVMLSSVTLGPPPKNMAAYVVVKAALLGLVRAAAVEYAAKGISVNAVSPYTVETQFLAEVPSKYPELAADANPMKRNARAADVVAAIEFLLSDGAEFLTGVNLPVAGGSVVT